MSATIQLTPIGIVHSPRQAAVDDYWGGLTATIEVDGRFPEEATAGLADFSHLEVIYQFHLVAEERIEMAARHPRNRTDWPKVGIFAQRGKVRPNRLGLSRCQIVAVDGRTITVAGLDAIDGSPVLDLKPYMTEFSPIGALRQPEWATELMADYYRPATADPRHQTR
jgi:tRNA-Thr(GGU) m(6)t(6)A37 methyltransferase TsaA